MEMRSTGDYDPSWAITTNTYKPPPDEKAAVKPVKRAKIRPVKRSTIKPAKRAKIRPAVEETKKQRLKQLREKVRALEAKVFGSGE